MNRETNSRFNFFLGGVVLLAALGGFLFGYETAVISGALSFIQQRFNTTTVMNEIIVSSLIFMAILGAAGSGKYTHQFGRRKLLLSAALCYIIGSICIAAAPSILIIIIGRLIVGLAIGVSSYVTPLFIAEMAPAYYRGRLLLINGIFITGGQVCALFIDYFFSFSADWRMMFLSGTLPALVLLAGSMIVPETPRWFILKGFKRPALKSLIQLRGFSYRRVIDEFREIQSCTSVPNQKIIISKEAMRPLIFVGIALGFFQQFFGINAIIYYGPRIFAMMGFINTSQQILSTLFITIVNAGVTILMMSIIDRIGRRPLLVSGSLIAGLSLMSVSLTIRHSELAWLTFAGLMLYIMGYCISVGSLFWVIISEIYPLSRRSLGMSIATSAQWSANLIVSSSFLTLIELFGASEVFLFFSLICFCCMVFCYYFIPETKRISLERIEKQSMLEQARCS